MQVELCYDNRIGQSGASPQAPELRPKERDDNPYLSKVMTPSADRVRDFG